MSNILMISSIYTITNIKRKTNAKMFKNLKIGDKIEFFVPIKPADGGYRGTYAMYIAIRNISTSEVALNSFNQLPKILESFELEVVE
jgi:hypothetical protein